MPADMVSLGWVFFMQDCGLLKQLPSTLWEGCALCLKALAPNAKMGSPEAAKSGSKQGARWKRTQGCLHQKRPAVARPMLGAREEQGVLLSECAGT